MSAINPYPAPSSYQSLEQEDHYGADDLARDMEEIRSLECTSRLRKCALKTTAAVCCPLSALFTYCSLCIVIFKPEAFSRRRDDRGVPYCLYTTCNSCCWNPALPPKDLKEMCRRAFDPFVCLICLSKESSDLYRTGPERQRMRDLKQRTERAQIIDKTLANENIPQDVAFLVVDYERGGLPQQNSKTPHSHPIREYPSYAGTVYGYTSRLI